MKALAVLSTVEKNPTPIFSGRTTAICKVINTKLSIPLFLGNK